ncbi:colicin E3/pyocin S6 family cytotoxin [Erythrobacter sp. W53]|uniref:colicin E3/pyocin S6 family cytotoxin n=1 Tax=Erythrobacter sp. W53 TaxID=3425947 RepID=UPI003D768B5C
MWATGLSFLVSRPDSGIQMKMRVPRPNPCFLDECVAIGSVKGEKRWRSADGKLLFTWDSLHGEIEVFNRRGKHIGVADAFTGLIKKPAVNGRSIDV